MKKTILTLGILSAMAFAANAQDVAPSTSELKAGKITVELNANSPFAGGTGSSNGTPLLGLSSNNISNLPSLRFRYFVTETMAFRLGLSINRTGFNNTYGNTTVTSNSGSNPDFPATGSGTANDNKVNLTSSTFQFSIMPGVEFHKLVSQRLSAYYGGYVEITSTSAKSKATISPGQTGGSSSAPTFDGSFTEEWKGASFGANAPTGAASAAPSASGTGLGGSTPFSGFSQNNLSSFRFGLVGVLGADYYFTKGLYLGVEVGWGLTTTTYKKLQDVITDSAVAHGDPAGSSNTTITNLDKNKSGLQLNPYASASLRLGFRF